MNTKPESPSMETARDLCTAQSWGADMSLSHEQFEALGIYASNLHRAETGCVAALYSNGTHAFAAPISVFWSILAAFRMAQGAGDNVSDAEVLRIGLNEVIQEGFSEDWAKAALKLEKLVAWQPKWIQRRLELVVGRFAQKPRRSPDGPSLRTLEYRFWLKSTRRLSAEAVAEG